MSLIRVGAAALSLCHLERKVYRAKADMKEVLTSWDNCCLEWNLIYIGSYVVVYKILTRH